MPEITTQAELERLLGGPQEPQDKMVTFIRSIFDYVQQRTQPLFKVTDYTSGPLTNDQRVGFQALATAVRAAGTGRIEFPPNEVIKVCQTEKSSQILMDLSGTRGVVVNFNGAKVKTDNDFLLNGNPSGLKTLIRADDVDGLVVNNPWFEMTDATAKGTLANTRGILTLAAGGVARGIRLNNFTQLGGYGVILIGTKADGSMPDEFLKANDIEFDGYAEDVYYPAVFQWNGNGVKGRLRVDRCTRAYFCYNVKDHDVDLDIMPGTTNEPILIKVYTDDTKGREYNTVRDINVSARMRDNPNFGAMGEPLHFSYQFSVGSAPGYIENVNARITLNSTNSFGELFGTSKFTTGAADTTGSRGHTFENVHIHVEAVFANNVNDLGRLFDSDGGTFDWTGENIRDVSLSGSVSCPGGTREIKIAGNLVQNSLRIEDFYAPQVTLTIATPAEGVLVLDKVNTANITMRGSKTFDPGSLADGAGETTTVTVLGARLGDFAEAGFSLNTSSITITAWVSAANTVSVRFQNESGGPLDIGSGTLYARAIPH